MDLLIKSSTFGNCILQILISKIYKLLKMKKIYLFFLALFIFTFAEAQNNCLDFDGINDYVSVSDDNSIDFGTSTDFTIEAWIKFSSSDNYDGIISKGSSGGGSIWTGYQFIIYDNKLALELNNGIAGNLLGPLASQGSLIGNTALNDGIWHHVAVAVSRTLNNVKFYVDGVEDASVNNTKIGTNNLDNSADLHIGADRETLIFYSGNIEEVKIWNDVRTESEIRANMYNELAGTESNLFAYYRFNEITGTIANDSQSASNNDGTLTNMDGNTDWVTSSAFAGPKNCLDFDGVDDYVDIGTGPTNIRTVEFWINPNSTTEYFIDLNGSAYISSNSGIISATGFTSPNVYVDGIVSTTIVSGKWQHIAVTSGANINATDLDIGRLEGQEEFDGKIDEVRLWSDVRTSKEIRENMCRAITGNETGLAAYYNFDNSFNTNLQDFSGNVNDGVLNNMTTSGAGNDWINSTAYNTWLNTNTTNCSLNTNWSRGISPVSTDNVGIANYLGGSRPTISNSTTVNHIIIESGDTLTLGINSSQAFTNNGNFLNYGTVLDTGNIINNGYIELNGNISCYNFTNNSGKTIKINSGSTLNISGTLTNNGIYIDQGTTRFDGTSAQYIPSLTYNNLTINNWTGVSLIGNSIVNSMLSLTLGNLNLSGHNIDLGTTGSLIETSGRIIGESGYIQATRTLNNPSADNVAGLGFEISSSQNLGSTLVKRGHTIQSGNGNKGIKRYFEVNPTTNTALNASIKFYYYDNELNDCNEVDLGLFKSTDGGSIWNNMGGIVNTTGNYVSLSGIDSFSIWTGGSSITHLTIVTLNSFDEVCIDAAAFTLIGGYPVGGTYSGAGVSGGIFDPAVAGAGTHTITYSYTDGNNSTNSASQNIVVNPLPVLSFSGLASTYCVNSTPDILTGTPASGGGGAIINCSSNCSMPTNYCSSTFTNTTDEWITQVTLNGDTNSSASTTYSDFTSTLFTTVKKDSSYSMSVTSFVAGYYSEVVSVYIDWNRNGTFDASEEILLGSQIGSHIYPQTFTVPSNAVLGETKMRVIIRYNLAPTACYSGIYGETEDYRINIIDVTQDGIGVFSGNGISGNIFDPALAGTGTHTITYSYTDGNNCYDFTTQNTFVNPPPVVTLNPFADVCENASAFTLTGGNPAGGTYSGIGVSGGIFNPATAGAGTHIISYSYTDGNNCTDSANQNIVVSSLPIVTLNSFIDYCVDATPFTLTGGSPAGGTYSGTGVSGGNFNPASAGVGIHTITYTYTDINLCTNFATQNIVVNVLPVVNFSGLASTYCLNSSPTLLTGMPANGGGGALIYCSSNCSMPTTYCPSSFTNTTDEWITQVDLHGGTNSSASTTYSDYTSTLFTTLKKDSTYSMSVTSFVAGYYSEVISAYFDWNRNGTFDTGEEVYFGSQIGTNTYYQTFTVPSNAVLGETKMRVILRYHLAPTPCYTGVYGETEDYRISIIDAVKDGVGVFSGNGISGNIFNPAIAGTGTHAITYFYTNSNGCSDSATQNTSVGALPIVTLNSFADVCENSPAFTLTGGNPAGGTYSGTGVSGGIFNPVIAGAGTNIISYSYTDGNNCTDSANQNIVVNVLPAVSLGSLSDVCVDAPTFTLTGGIPAGGTYSGTGVSGGSFNPATAGAGTHLITYSYTDANSCTNFATQNIIVNDLPIVTLNPFTDVCVDAPTFILTGGNPAGGTYSGTGVSGGNFNPATAGVGTHIITYSYTDGNSCFNSTTQSINVNALPTVTFSSLSDVCVDALPFILSGGNPAGGTYSGTGVIGGGFNPATAGVGTHIISYSYTDGNNCTDSANQNIVVSSLPIVTLNSFIDYCVDAPTFTLTGGIPAGGTYSGTGVSGGSFNPSAAGAGTHIITYSYTDANSCTNFATQNIIVNDLPTVTLNPFGDVCVDAPTFTLTGGNPVGGTYSGTGVSSGSFSPTTAGLGTHIITYSYTDGNSCFNSTTQNINVNALPTVTLSSFSDVCVDALPFTLSGGSPVGGIYSGTGVIGGDFNPSVAGVGTHLITYTFTDGNSCTNFATQNITVNPLPIVSYSGLASDYCVYDPQVTIVPIPTGGTLIGSGISGINFTPSIAGVGIHTIIYTYTDANACMSTYSQIVNVNPNYFFQQSIVICDNDSLLFGGNYLKYAGTYYDSLTTVDGCDSVYELQLYISPIYHFVQQNTICFGDSLLWQGNYYSVADTFYVNYNLIGCDSIYELQLFVNPTYYYVEQDTVCSGDSLFWHGNYYSVANTFYTNYNSINGCDSIYELQLFVNPTYYFVEQDTICSGDSLLWQGNYYSVADTFYANYNSINGCDSIYELQLFLNPAYYFIEQDTICSNDSLFWQGNYYSTADTFLIFYYTIKGCDSIFELQLTVNPSYLQIPVLSSICQNDSILLGGTYQTKAGVYYDNYLTLAGCDSIIETTLSVNSLPIVTVSVYPDSLEKGNCAELSATGGIDYSWTPVSWLDNPLIATPISCTKKTIVYYVEVTDINGCSQIDSITVIVYLLDDLILFIPNTFTPNGDGKNDKWVIKHIDKFPGNSVTIYNRWGNKVFSSTNYKNDWDGNNLPIGTYFYIIDLNRGKKALRGDINILR